MCVRGEFEVDKASSLVEAEFNFEVRLEQVQARGDLVKTLLQSPHHVTKLVMGEMVPSGAVVNGGERTVSSILGMSASDVPRRVGPRGSSRDSEYTREFAAPGEVILTNDLHTPTSWNVGRRNFDVEEFWDSAKREICWHLTRLKNVEIVNLDANWPAWEPVLSLLEFLLENAPRLDKMEMDSNNSRGSKAAEPWAPLEVAWTILSHPNRSPSLKVVLSHPSQGHPSTSVLKCDLYISPDVVLS